MNKTIEERAYDKFCNENCCRDCQNCSDRTECLEVNYVWAFIDGAQSEHEKLMKWNSPEIHPDLDEDGSARNVLLDYGGGYGVGCYNHFQKCWQDDWDNEVNIVGWREIHE